MKEMINLNGKLFPAPTKLLPSSQDSFRLCPTFSLKSLDGQRRNLMDLASTHKATLLTVSCSSFADPMVESFRKPYLQQKFSAGLLDLRPIPSALKAFIWSSSIKRAARKEIPDHLHPTYFVYRGGQELRGMLGLPNLYGGYACLLDREGVLRWRASGFATASELDLLFKFVNELQRDHP